MPLIVRSPARAPTASERVCAGLANPVDATPASWSNQRASRPVNRRVHVSVIVPCFNRPGDVEALLADLAGIRLEHLAASGPPFAIDLRVVIVDNASVKPISDLPLPPGLNCTHVRLATNTGGSGGYNAGLALALGIEPDRLDGAVVTAASKPGPGSASHTHLVSCVLADPQASEFVWLVDSDARVGPATLAELLEPMLLDESIVAAGAALHDVETGQCFELGGRVNIKTGRFEAAVPGVVGVGKGLVECDYVAACCALVRADAVRAAGLMPDVFLNADDVEWCIRLAQRTGGRVVAVPAARAMHPRCDRPPGWQRLYMARNALGPLAALGAPRRVRRARALHEVARSIHQQMIGRPDHAELHLRGLRNLVAGQRYGPCQPAPKVESSCALDQAIEQVAAAFGGPEGLSGRRALIAECLPDVVDPSMSPASWHTALSALGVDARIEPLCSRPSGVGRSRRAHADIAVVPTRRTRGQWLAGQMLVLVGAGGAEVRSTSIRSRLHGAITAAMVGVPLALRAARAELPGPSTLDLSMAAARASSPKSRAHMLSLEVIILSYNRRAVLAETLRILQQDPAMQRASRKITVVDNASTDGTLERLQAEFPSVNIIARTSNQGIEGFNHAARLSRADVLLILDDDARPAEHALSIALERLATREWLDAVTLLPAHPSSGKVEWPFATALAGVANDAWPVMGCANLVRRSAWERAGGYASEFFLYRNDMELALKLLDQSRGRQGSQGGARSLGGVHFDSALRAWHDSPVQPAGQRSIRWHELATRNWIWTAREHGLAIGVTDGAGATALGALAGWGWAHAAARFSMTRQIATLRGALAGLVRQSPVRSHEAVKVAVPPDCCDVRRGWAWRRLLRLRFLGRIAPGA